MTAQGNSKPTQNNNRATWTIQSLDSVDRLAIYIFGMIAMEYPEAGGAICQLDQQVAHPQFWEKLSDTIREAVPLLDLVELRHIQDAQQSKSE